jgi:hypothetical protein
MYRCVTRGPVELPARDGGGSLQIWEVSEASLEGDTVHAELAAPGADWMSASSDGVWRHLTSRAASSRAGVPAAQAPAAVSRPATQPA